MFYLDLTRNSAKVKPQFLPVSATVLAGTSQSLIRTGTRGGGRAEVQGYGSAEMAALGLPEATAV